MGAISVNGQLDGYDVIWKFNPKAIVSISLYPPDKTFTKSSEKIVIHMHSGAIWEQFFDPKSFESASTVYHRLLLTWKNHRGQKRISW